MFKGNCTVAPSAIVFETVARNWPLAKVAVLWLIWYK
jgi:hypothetical protein